MPKFDWTYHSGNGSVYLRSGPYYLDLNAYADTERLYTGPLAFLLPGRRLFRLGRYTVIVGRHYY